MCHWHPGYLFLWPEDRLEYAAGYYHTHADTEILKSELYLEIKNIKTAPIVLHMLKFCHLLDKLIYQIVQLINIRLLTVSPPLNIH